MFKKKIDVVELNKKEEKILLEETTNPLILFLRRNRGLILSIILILAILLLSISAFFIIRSFKLSTGPEITKINLEISEIETTDISISSEYSLTEKTAMNSFNKNGNFKKNGEVLLTKTITAGSYTIKYYSDGTALKIMKNGLITRINHLSNGNYGINESGVLNPNAELLDVTIIDTKKYPWGEVNYYSDGSAIVLSKDIELFVRNSSDIKDNYISDNKVSYLKESKIIGSNTKVNYYYDGTIEVIKDNKTYVVRNEEDIKIDKNNVTFPNNNAATITSTKKYDDGKTVKYLSDGGAIIEDGTRAISVRKSNSIIIKDNKIYEIVDNIYVSVASKKNGVTYYTNGGAITEYNGKTVYVKENSDIKYNKNNKINKIENNIETRTSKTKDNNGSVETFETVALIETKDYMAIVDADAVLYDSDGSFKEILESQIEEDGNNFKITNNTTDKVKYRIVIERSDRTNLDVEYIRYQLKVKDTYVAPSKLDKEIWEDKALASKLSVKGTNYILVESTMEPLETVDVNLMLWTDYETIPNEMQNKYFYGTIKVYAWKEK